MRVGVVARLCVGLLATLIAILRIQQCHAILGCCSCVKNPVIATWRFAKHNFFTIGFHLYVNNKPWINASTADDIVKVKYLYMDLLSKKHNSWILATPEEDDHVNNRTNIIRYHMDAAQASEAYPGLTIGCVYWYKQKLQCNLGHDSRIVWTYFDEQKRFCVRIESFDSNGTRQHLRIMRKHNRWFLQLIINEKKTMLGTLRKTLQALAFWSSSGGQKQRKAVARTRTVNIPDDQGFENFQRREYEGLWFYYNRKPMSGCEDIATLTFRTKPLDVTPGLYDLYIWRYFKDGDSGHITWIVVLEYGDDVKLNFYKCLDYDQRQYQPVDSFAVPSAFVKKLEVEMLSYKPSKLLEKAFKYVTRDDARVRHLSDKNMHIHAYPASNHIQIRPKLLQQYAAVNAVYFVDAKGPHGLSYPNIELWSYISLGTRPKAVSSLASIVHFTLQGPDYGTEQVVHNVGLGLEHEFYTYDYHTLALLQQEKSPWYYAFAFDILAPTLVATSANLDALGNEFVAGTYQNSHSFITLDLFWQQQRQRQGKAANFLNLFQGQGANITLDTCLNTQLIYVEDADGNDSVVAMQTSGISLYKLSNGGFQIEPDANVNDKLREFNLQDLAVKPEINVTSVELHLDAIVPPVNVHVLTLSADAVLYFVDEHVQISSIVYGTSAIVPEPGHVQVLNVTQGDLRLVVVDVVPLKENVGAEGAGTKNVLIRQCYHLFGEKAILQSSIELRYSSISELRWNLHKSWYDLLPVPLPLYADWEDERIQKISFKDAEFSVIHTDYTNPYQIGHYVENSTSYNIPKDFRWRQVLRYNKIVPKIQSVFTMTRDGIVEEQLAEKNTSIVRFNEEPPRLTTPDAIPVFADVLSHHQPGLVFDISKGSKTVIKAASPNARLNPIVFGAHEITLAVDVKVLNVTVEETNGVLTIAIHARKQNMAPQVFAYKQQEANGTLYELVSNVKNKEGWLVDSMATVHGYIGKEWHDAETFDLNAPKIPTHVRYLTLGSLLIYYTGTVKSRNGLEFIYGNDQKYTINGPGTMFHVWVRYPNENIKTAAIFIYHRAERVDTTEFISLEDTKEAAKLQRPSGLNYNWGPISNAEAQILNARLVRMAFERNHLVPVDLNLECDVVDEACEGIKVPPGIMQVALDDSTWLYTCAAHSGLVIGNVKTGNLLIRHESKLISRQVYYATYEPPAGGHETPDNKRLVVVASRTFVGTGTVAYLFENGTWEQIDVADIDVEHFPALARFRA